MLGKAGRFCQAIISFGSKAPVLAGAGTLSINPGLRRCRARVGDLYLHEIGDVVSVSRVQRVKIIEDETARLRTCCSYGCQGSTNKIVQVGGINAYRGRQPPDLRKAARNRPDRQGGPEQTDKIRLRRGDARQKSEKLI